MSLNKISFIIFFSISIYFYPLSTSYIALKMIKMLSNGIATYDNSFLTMASRKQKQLQCTRTVNDYSQIIIIIRFTMF